MGVGEGIRRRVAADTSSLILLRKADLFTIFLNSYDILLAEDVYRELTVYDKEGASDFRLRLGGHIAYSSGYVIGSLGAGESGTVALYQNGDVDFVLLDDKKGANYCKRRSIPFVNSLLISRILYLSGVISLKEMVRTSDLLKRFGYYSSSIVAKASCMEVADVHKFFPHG